MEVSGKQEPAVKGVALLAFAEGHLRVAAERTDAVLRHLLPLPDGPVERRQRWIFARNFLLHLDFDRMKHRQLVLDVRPPPDGIGALPAEVAPASMGRIEGVDIAVQHAAKRPEQTEEQSGADRSLNNPSKPRPESTALHSFTDQRGSEYHHCGNDHEERNFGIYGEPVDDAIDHAKPPHKKNIVGICQS